MCRYMHGTNFTYWNLASQTNIVNYVEKGQVWEYREHVHVHVHVQVHACTCKYTTMYMWLSEVYHARSVNFSLTTKLGKKN